MGNESRGKMRKKDGIKRKGDEWNDVWVCGKESGEVKGLEEWRIGRFGRVSGCVCMCTACFKSCAAAQRELLRTETRRGCGPNLTKLVLPTRPLLVQGGDTNLEVQFPTDNAPI